MCIRDSSQSRSSGNGWTTPTRVGPEQMSGDPAGARNKDGRMEVFAGLVGSGAANVWQTSANGPWSAWGSLPGANPVTITTATNADGRLVLIARQPNGELRIANQNS